MGYYHDGGWSGGDWIAMVLMMVAFWGVVVALAVWIVHSLRAPRGETHDERRPADILAERYARGEIDDDEYRRRNDVLAGTSGRT